jgi:hypothetical protein
MDVCFAGAQALEDTTHGGHTETQPLPVVAVGTELLQGGIGLLADELAHQRQRHRVAARLASPGMRPWSHFPARAPSSQQLLENRVADTKAGGYRALGATLVVVSIENFLSYVQSIGFHEA